MIQFHCKSCGQEFSVPEINAGKKGRCPKCKNVVIVPQSAAPSPSSLPQQEDEPLRLKYDSDLPTEPARPIYTLPQQEHRAGPEPLVDIAADAGKLPPPSEEKPATLLDIFTFPISVLGIIHLLLFWLGPFLIGLLQMTIFLMCCYGAGVIMAAYLLLFAYFYYYLSNCVIAAAKGEHSAPDVSLGEVTTVGDLLRHLLLLFAAAFICFGPSFGYTLYLYFGQDLVFPAWRTDTVYWLLYGLGVFLFPMFLLAVVMFDSTTALNPFLIIGSVVSTFLPYCGLSVLFFIIGLIMLRITYFTPAWAIASWGFDVYLMFVAAYVLGRFYRRYENRLNWEIKL
jgi:DNA-directed RNA polymerase subunit RPC12/RpoP